MACFPIYSPENSNPGWAPSFIPGPTPCTLDSSNETRSRLVAGGTFFRSLDVATDRDVNTIGVGCVVTPQQNEIIPGVPDDTILTVERCIVYITLAGVLVNSHLIYQKRDSVTGACALSGISELRNSIKALDITPGDPLVRMPTDDAQTTWTDNDCFLTAFTTTFMTGGITAPAYSASTRTGPTYGLHMIANSEKGVQSGALTPVNKILEWNGLTSEWITHPSPGRDPDTGLPCP